MSDDDENENGSASLPPRVGEYDVVVLDDTGQVTERFQLQTRTAFPVIGSAIDVLNEDGSRTPYRVLDVRHPEEEADSYSQWRFTGYVAIVRRDERPVPSLDPGGPGRKSDPFSHQPPSASAASVIDFRPRQPETRSRLMAFFKLVGWIVWEGYREQTQLLETWKFGAWQLQWDGHVWLLRQLAGDRSAADFRELSRAAKRSAVEALAFLEQLRAIPDAAEDHFADVIALDTYRTREAKS